MSDSRLLDGDLAPQPPWPPLIGRARLGIVETRTVTAVSEVFHNRLIHKSIVEERWFLAGHGTTDTLGRCEIDLTACLPDPQGDEQLGGAPWVLVTAETDQPCLLTVTHRLSPLAAIVGHKPGWTLQPYQVLLTIHSWSADGVPAPNIPFAWQCAVEKSLYSPG